MLHLHQLHAARSHRSSLVNKDKDMDMLWDVCRRNYHKLVVLALL
jgi:hypothetical protein